MNQSCDFKVTLVTAKFQAIKDCIVKPCLKKSKVNLTFNHVHLIKEKKRQLSAFWIFPQDEQGFECLKESQICLFLGGGGETGFLYVVLVVLGLIL